MPDPNNLDVRYETYAHASSQLICIYCGESPCEWYTVGMALLSKVIPGYQWYANKKFLKELPAIPSYRDCGNKIFREYIYLKYGPNGSDTRTRIPHCVLNNICDLLPSPSGCYGEFKEN